MVSVSKIVMFSVLWSVAVRFFSKTVRVSISKVVRVSVSEIFMASISKIVRHCR